MYKTVNPFIAPAKVSNLFLNLKFPCFSSCVMLIYEEGTSCAGTAATGWAGIVKRLWVEAMGTPPGT